MKRQATHLKLVAAALLGLAGTAAPASAQTQEAVKIGYPASSKILLGSQMVRGANIAAAMINEKGGILGGRKVELIHYDTAVNPSEGVAAIQRLLNQDRVNVLAGEVTSTVALAQVPVIKSAGALFLIGLPKHPDLTKAENKNVLRVNSTVTMDMAAFKPIFQERFGDKKVALITENNEAWQEGAKIMRSEYFKPGQLVFDEAYEIQQNDFTSLVTNARRSRAEVLCILGTTPEHYANIIRMAGEIGYRPQICLTPGILYPGAVEIAGEAAEGAVSADIYVPNIQNDLNKAFVAAFQKAHGDKPDKAAMIGFETVWVLAKAMDQAKSTDDPTKIAETIRSNTWATPRGDIRFDQNGQASGKYYVITVKDGKIEQWN